MKKGIRVWICDHCGKRETWRAGWCCFPCVESPKNKGEDGLLLPMAGCNDNCLYNALDDLIVTPHEPATTEA